MRKPIQLPQTGQQKLAPPGPDEELAPVRSLYLHIPFCTHKCHYCDFYSVEIEDRGRHKAFVEALEMEIAALGALKDAIDERHPKSDNRLRTIFAGGGTPSLLSPDLWERVLRALRDAFDLSATQIDDWEFTVECNPESVSAELMTTLREGGVNRISVGAQSFDARHLALLERIHEPENVQRALQMAHDAGVTRRSVDLIFGIPGQSIDEWMRDLDQVLQLDPGVDHVSCYALTYEPNTPLTVRMRRGEFTPMDQDRERELMSLTRDRLRKAGFERYEISNFARTSPAPGKTRSRHNEAYWRGMSWFAAGPSASGHLLVDERRPERGGWRFKNVPRLADWAASVRRSGGRADVVDLEGPDSEQALVERLLMELRVIDGIDIESIRSHASHIGAEDELVRRVTSLIDRGHMEAASGRWRLTDEGVYLTDAIVGELCEAINRADSI